MNIKKKIGQYLRAAPKPLAPDNLLNKLQEDAAVTNVKPHASFARRFFAPTGQSISFRRVAYAAVIVIAVMLPLSYGAAKVIKHFKVFEAMFEYPEDNTVYTVIDTVGSDTLHSEEDAKKSQKEFYRLYKEGKAEEVEPGVWVVTLSDGTKSGYAGDPEVLGLSETERKELLKKQFDEINELRKAGKFEKTYKPEHDFEVDGVKYRYFEARYTLSSRKIVTIGSSEPVKDDEDKD